MGLTVFLAALIFTIRAAFLLFPKREGDVEENDLVVFLEEIHDTLLCRSTQVENHSLMQRFSTQITPRPVFYHDLQFLNIK